METTTLLRSIFSSIQILSTLFLGFATIWAIRRAPKDALRLQKELETNEKRKERQTNLLKTLMATRVDPRDLRHVEAINIIDVEFYGCKKITDACTNYRGHLNKPGTTGSHVVWNTKRLEYLNQLLLEMSNFLGYDFNEDLMKNGYLPDYYYQREQANQAFTKEVMKVLTRESSLKVEFVNNPKTAILNTNLQAQPAELTDQ